LNFVRVEIYRIHELHSAIRAGGCASPASVHVAMLETSGHVTVIPLKDK